jgi:hypothetical protein
MDYFSIGRREDADAVIIPSTQNELAIFGQA